MTPDSTSPSVPAKVDLEDCRLATAILLATGTYSEEDAAQNRENIDLIEQAVNDEDGEAMAELLSLMRSWQSESATLTATLKSLCERVEKQTRVNEAIILRDAHPETKLSDGSHVIQMLSLHIYDAIADARRAAGLPTPTPKKET